MKMEWSVDRQDYCFLSTNLNLIKWRCIWLTEHEMQKSINVFDEWFLN